MEHTYYLGFDLPNYYAKAKYALCQIFEILGRIKATGRTIIIQ